MKMRITKPIYAIFLLVALLLSARSSPAQIRMRGITTDLTSTADQFISLDLNGDGKTDLLYYRPGGGFARAYLSHGDGTFREVSYVESGAGFSGFPGDLSSSKDTFVAGDFNGDGKSDFIEYRPGSGFTFRCLSNGDGSVNCVQLSSPGQQYFGFKDTMTNGNERIVTMDLNHDGLTDFIVYTPTGGTARAYLSLPNGNLQEIDLTTNGSANTAVGFAEDMEPSSVRIVPLDANGDGYADLLVYTPQYSEVRLYLNNKNNAFQLVTLAYGGTMGNGFQNNAGDSNSHLIALDLNGDGKSDFLWWQAGSGVVTGYLSTGTGTFTAVPYQSSGSTLNGFVSPSGSTADTAIALNLNNGPYTGFLWYTPGGGNVVAYNSSSSGTLTAEKLTTNGTEANGFKDTDASPNSVALAANFRGYSDSGAFFWYAPGTGSLLQAYERIQGPGFPLNLYSFTTYPATYLSDLNWSIGNVPIKEVVMLGTHDSAMYSLNGGQGDLAETQLGDLTYQLGDGARVFDFRSGYYNFSLGCVSQYADLSGTCQSLDTAVPSGSGFFMFGHSTVLTDYSPFYLISQVEDWLIQNPNEVALIDMANTSGSGTGPLVTNGGTSYGPQYEQGLQQTDNPQLIYTPSIACGSTTCPSSYNPQNRSINSLKALGTRLILMNVPSVISAYGWQNSTHTAGYCTPTYGAISFNGVSAAHSEIDCINNDLNGAGNEPTLSSIRPNYTAADADKEFFRLSAELTPDGAVESNGDVMSGVGPILLSDNSSYGFNVGGGSYNLPAELASGEWSINALNLIYLDGIEGDPVEGQFIQRNNQTWLNANFFNTNYPQAAGAISVSSNGTVWAAGSGHSVSIFQYNPTTGTWVDKINSEPNVKKLAADANGGVWVIEEGPGSAGPLVYYNANGQKTTTSSVVEDVAVGADGSVWAIGDVNNLFNYQAGASVQPSSVPAQYGIHLAVDNRGYPWVVQVGGAIQRFNGTVWGQVTGVTANEIAISADGSVLITGADTPSVGRLNNKGSNFDFLLMDADHIAVDGLGHPWAIRHGTGVVYKGALDQM